DGRFGFTMLRATQSLIGWLGQRPERVLVVLAVLIGLTGGTIGIWWAQGQRPAAEEALARGDLEEAGRHLAWCLRIWPRDTTIQLLAARLARRQDRYDEATHHLEACQRLGGVSAESALEWSLLRAQQGDLADEGLLLERIGQDRPETPMILEALVQGYLAS